MRNESRRRFRATLCILSACLSALAACAGQEGTIVVSIISAPDSDLLRRVHRLTATAILSADGELSAQFEGVRDANNELIISIELEADGSNRDLAVVGYDQNGTEIAVGRVGPLPLGAFNAEVAVYMAEPMSIREAPISLATPRSDIGGIATPASILLAGGLTTKGPTDTLEAYSSYVHTLEPALSMPVPLSNPTLAWSANGFLYLTGGSDRQSLPSNTALAFDSKSPPRGAFRSLQMAEQFARSGATAAMVAPEMYLITGDPALLLDGLRGTLEPIPGGDHLNGAAVRLSTGIPPHVVIAGGNVASGAARYQQGQVQRLTPPPAMSRIAHRGIGLPTNQALFLGGAIDGVATTSAVIYDADSGSFQTIELLQTARRHPAVAITNRYLLVVGGEADNGTPIGDVEIFDATTLTAITHLPLLVPRKNTSAHALNNGQVLIAGGIDAQGEPIAILELFTPAP